MEDTLFITPEGHKGFSAKKLFNEMGKNHVFATRTRIFIKKCRSKI